MEHRCGERLKILLPTVVITSCGSAMAADVRDVSITGAFLTSALEVASPAFIHLALPAEDGDRRCVHWVRALVVRTNADGFGVEWIDELAVERVHRLIARRATREWLRLMDTRRQRPAALAAAACTAHAPRRAKGPAPSESVGA
jgi:PilZ domain-containing protein